LEKSIAYPLKIFPEGSSLLMPYTRFCSRLYPSNRGIVLLLDFPLLPPLQVDLNTEQLSQVWLGIPRQTPTYQS
jgi:hypothetical protein